MGGEYETSDFNAGEERVFEWEDGLPNSEDLTPLSQMLIPTELASAFSITPEPCRNMGDVDRASWDTVSKLQSRAGIGLATNRSKTLPPLSNGCFLHENGANANDDLPSSPTATGDDDDDDDSKRDQDSESAGLLMENSMDDLSARALKRPRLVWTPQLHKRFVDVVSHLGIKNAVPKTIMQLMNVEGLTRENVASHLQKYRLYLKRMQGFPDQGPSSSLDQLFASTPIPNGGRAGPSVLPGHREEPSSHMPIPLPYVAGPFVPMPVVGVAHGRGPLPIPGPATYNMFETQSANGCGRNLIPQRMSAGDQPRDW